MASKRSPFDVKKKTNNFSVREEITKLADPVIQEIHLV